METQSQETPVIRWISPFSDERKKRRWPWLIALLVPLVAIPYLAWATNYQPLSGDTRRAVNFRYENARNLGVVTSPGGERFSVVRVPIRAGQTFSYGFVLSNSGPVGVTVTEVGRPYPVNGPVKLLGVSADLTGQASGLGDLEPMRPFSLGAHEHRQIWIKLKFARCFDGLTLGSEPVGFRVGGLNRHTTVLLPVSYQLIGESCPDVG